MHLATDRTHRFEVDPQRLWDALTDIDDYPRWWPWLRSFEAEAFAPGARWRCVVRPPLGYPVRFAITLGEVAPPRHADAVVGGDIEGHARLDITGHGQGSELRLVSELRPVSPLVRVVTRLASPVARTSHDWVLDTGLRQFRRHAL